MKRFYLPYLTLVCIIFLAACSSRLTPNNDATLALTPLTFGSSGYDYAAGLAKHSSGVYVVGYTQGNLHNKNKGNEDAFIRKYHKSGELLWGRQFGTPSIDLTADVASYRSNSAYVVGTVWGSLAGSRGNSDIFVRKYTSGGAVSWTRQFGSSSQDFGQGVAVYGNSIYVVGNTHGDLTGKGQNEDGRGDAFIRKYGSSANILWTRQFGTSQEYSVTDVSVDSSGNIYVVGNTWGALTGNDTVGNDMFIRKYNSAGGVLWTKQLDYDDIEYANAVVANGSNIYVAGNYFTDFSGSIVRVIKLHVSGSTIWDRAFGPSSSTNVTDVTADNSGVTFVSQNTDSFAGPYQGGGDGYVYKLKPNGTYAWSKQIGTGNYDGAEAVMALSGEVYVAGFTFGVLGSVSSGDADAYLTRLNGTTGPTVWTDQ